MLKKVYKYFLIIEYKYSFIKKELLNYILLLAIDKLINCYSYKNN